MTSNQMKALVKAKPEEGLWMERVPVPEIGPDDVLIKIRATGICGTDIHIWNWDDWAQKTVPVPLVTGHEFAGEIVEIGRNVDDLTIGQRCSGEGHLIGKHSRQSRAGKFHLDPETRGIGVNEQGAFAQYLRLPAFNVVPLPDSIPDEIGAILDPLGNAVHTALSFDLVGEDVLITGAGPIGIMAAAVARHVGARHVVITDVNPDRLALAGQVADVVPVNVGEEDLKDVVARLGMKEGFDVGLEMSGNQRALDQMVETLVMGGRIALLGIPPGKSPVDWSRIVFKAITIKGVYGREIFETWYKMIAMLENGLDVSRVITHRFPVDSFEEGFAVMKSGKSGKVVLDWA
ncbi:MULTISPECIES: L-threonine 3-dehydrogenase [Mameliella]|jgi:threonine 3-dehydrogenase|uniref:L-threonine 3-dehydrogenase n=1 Tax=Mameliella alba TaxID=561184 RepID=A0A0B3RH70_9RHOB|nr:MULTISPECIES: L-threonine 3-dehydrogenase [Mameliella]MCR9275997.1 L-threonine 3-dehydrogenase [Paracoccaceae bacterium]KHQ50645.1 L-threonine 3-dehydrogenase [Mameliella alba]OWV40691.1 L-threonine 3-dehydrogenase [Mameliella alba]OWV53245.1 L-threonine 3-dehydrogenase [Mameliella alba]OWV55123.1 L-threonine 3-dehydrogenase [Mameliella alba]